MEVLLCYDVSSDKGRRLIEKTASNYGERVQFSVFICDLKSIELADLKRDLRQIVKRYTSLYDSQVDSIMIISLCQSCSQTVTEIMKRRKNKSEIII